MPHRQPMIQYNVSPRPAASSDARPNRGRLRKPTRRLHEGAALRSEDAFRRLRLPAARHAQRPLPLPRRQEHGRPDDGRRSGPLCPCPPQARVLQCRDGRPPPRSQDRHPPRPRPARRPPRQSRWTWGASIVFAPTACAARQRSETAGDRRWSPRRLARAERGDRSAQSAFICVHLRFHFPFRPRIQGPQADTSGRWTWGAFNIFRICAEASRPLAWSAVSRPRLSFARTGARPCLPSHTSRPACSSSCAS